MIPSINVNKSASKPNVNNHNNHEHHTSNTTTSIPISPNPSSNKSPNKSPNAATSNSTASNTTNKLNDSPPKRNKPRKRKNNQTDFCCAASRAIV